MTELKPCPFCGGDKTCQCRESTYWFGKLVWACNDCERTFDQDDIEEREEEGK